MIVDSVQRVAPFFDEFLLEPRRLKSTDIKLEWRHKKSDQYFDASSLSDGTLALHRVGNTCFFSPSNFVPSIHPGG